MCACAGTLLCAHTHTQVGSAPRRGVGRLDIGLNSGAHAPSVHRGTAQVKAVHLKLGVRLVTLP